MRGKHFLDFFFNPESVAIVGASGKSDTFNYSFVANLVNHKFPGKIYPVNPKAKEILGLKAYPDLKSIQGDIDLVIISIPASETPDVIKDCVAKRVKGVSLVPGGFSETGERGKRIQDEMLSLLRANGIRAVGPNALSPINTQNGFVISFTQIDRLNKGGLSFIFQSGLYELRLNWMFTDFHLNISKLIDLGNKMDVNEVDALEYLGQDPDTKVIAMHLESVAGDARAFMQLLKDISKRKPVIVLKAGRTAAGAKAASSHTGALASSSDAIFEAAFKQTGAIRTYGLDDFFDQAKAFEYLPPLQGNRVAILVVSGGEGVLTTDTCELNGLTLAHLSPETQDRLRTVFPPWDIPVNPFDKGVCIQFHHKDDIYGLFTDTCANDPNVDCLAIQTAGLFPAGAEQLVKSCLDVVKKGKPVVTWMTDPSWGKGTIQLMEKSRIPMYPSAERAIKALAAMYRYSARHDGV